MEQIGDRGISDQQFNRLHGTEDNALSNLNNFCYYNSNDTTAKENRQKLLNQNRGFYFWIMADVAGKNKLDIPTTQDKNKIAFQDKKLRCLFKAISEKTTSETGYENKFALGSHGNSQAMTNAVRGFGSQLANMGRGVSRITNPTSVGNNEDRGSPDQQFNKLSGTEQEALSNLNNFCKYDDDSSTAKKQRQTLLNQNRGFYTWVMIHVAGKNKLDYPPFGPTTPAKIEFQDKKLRCLFKAIAEKTTSETGIETTYSLGSHGVLQQYASGIRGIGSQLSNMGRGISRGPTSGLSSTYKSVGNIMPNSKNVSAVGNSMTSYGNNVKETIKNKSKGWFWGGNKRKGKKGTRKSTKRGTKKTKK